MKKSLITLCAMSAWAMASAGDGDAQLKAMKDTFQRPTEIQYSAENPFTPEKLVLGKALFFDPRISASNVTSCATCHNPSFSWTDGLGHGVGQGHQQLTRKTPTLLNLAWTARTNWDGHFTDLENEVGGPMGNPAVMNGKAAGAEGVNKIKAIAGYREMFQSAYPNQEISNELIGKAIGIFERGIVSGTAPFDKWIAGDESAISPSAKHGFVLFNDKAKCVVCHAGWSFSDGSFRDIGLKGEDIGRGKWLKMTSQSHAFKTPGLRNIASRFPYMHDGSEATLLDVINFYDRGGDVARESKAQELHELHLTDKEKHDLVAFLETLTSVDAPVTIPPLPR